MLLARLVCKASSLEHLHHNKVTLLFVIGHASACSQLNKHPSMAHLVLCTWACKHLLTAQHTIAQLTLLFVTVRKVVSPARKRWEVIYGHKQGNR